MCVGRAFLPPSPFNSTISYSLDSSHLSTIGLMCVCMCVCGCFGELKLMDEDGHKLP